MRMTVFALALLPIAAHAQSTTTDPAPRSCAAGTVRDTATGLCLAADEKTPLQDFRGGHNCSGAQQVTS